MALDRHLNANGFDLGKAFDVVDHHWLLKKIGYSDLHSNLKRWLVAYRRDRRVWVVYEGKLSKWRKVKMGVPQGSVLSPLLFNFFVNDIATSAEIDESYADDFHAAASHVSPMDIAYDLAASAEELSRQAECHGLSLLAAKSTTILFTRWNKEFGRLPPVALNGNVIPQANNPKLVGVIFDPTFTFSAHASAIAWKAGSRLGVLRALSNTVFGHDKECLELTFKALIRPFLSTLSILSHPSAASIWSKTARYDSSPAATTPWPSIISTPRRKCCRSKTTLSYSQPSSWQGRNILTTLPTGL